MGDRGLWEFFIGNRDDADRNPLEEWRERANEAVERATDLEERLRAYQDAAEADVDVQEVGSGCGECFLKRLADSGGRFHSLHIRNGS